MKREFSRNFFKNNCFSPYKSFTSYCRIFMIVLFFGWFSSDILKLLFVLLFLQEREAITFPFDSFGYSFVLLSNNIYF